MSRAIAGGCAARTRRGPKREVLWHEHAPYSSFTQHRRDYVRESRVFHAFLAQPLLVAAQGKHAASVGFFSRAVDFQVAHHHATAAPHPQIDERVGHEHPGRVEHVGVMLAIRHH